MRYWLLAFLCLFPILAQAAIFDVPSTDKSMQYLGMIFGPVAGLPIKSSDNSFFALLLYIFNQIVFALAIVIIIYTTVVGVIHTAQEGKFLGSKWHSLLVPIRAALGLYLLLPSPSGYNWIQVGVLWFIIQGVGAANALWTQVIIAADQQGGNVTEDSSKVDFMDAGETVIGLFNAVLCMETLNRSDKAMKQLKEPIRVYRLGDKINFGRISNQGGYPLCGQVSLKDPGQSSLFSSTGNNSVSETRKNILADAIFRAQATLQPSAIEALTSNSDNWRYGSSFVSASNLLKSTTQQMTFSMQDLSKQNRRAIIDGWIHAGAYYFELVSKGATGSTVVSIPVSEPDQGEIFEELGKSLGKKKLAEMNEASSSYINYASANILNPSDDTANKLVIQKSGGGNKMGKIYDALFGKMFKSLSKSVQKNMTGGGKKDPLIAMSNFGKDLLTISEYTFFGSLIAIFLIWLAVSSGSCANPTPHAMDKALFVIMPIAFIIIGMLWLSGVLLAIYVPLIPYLIFTFAALGWIILVIEALIGAPLIALTLIIPSEDEIGKAGHGILILVSLFLRPALMILGFVIAIKLLAVVIDMINFGFFATLKNATGSTFGLGIFAFFAVMMLYTMTCVSLVQEAFSIIYILPNKILRWMGGQQEGEDVGGFVKEMRQKAESGAQTTQGIMKGMIGEGTKQTKELRKEQMKEAKNKGGSRS